MALSPLPGTTHSRSTIGVRRPPRWLGPALLCLAALCAPILIPLALAAGGTTSIAAAAAGVAVLAGLTWTLWVPSLHHDVAPNGAGAAGVQWDWDRFEADFAAYAAERHVRGRRTFDGDDAKGT